mmetsp:Transcript_20521/g.41024  ORF Transcript_20521/g.41024 Transcript_20521/m.41024 type:complete len:101 (+) Transcript_20521:1271-1573(+)
MQGKEKTSRERETERETAGERRKCGEFMHEKMSEGLPVCLSKLSLGVPACLPASAASSLNLLGSWLANLQRDMLLIHFFTERKETAAERKRCFDEKRERG